MAGGRADKWTPRDPTAREMGHTLGARRYWWHRPTSIVRGSGKLANMKQMRDLVVCDGCDAVYRKPVLRARETARCTRCGTELARNGAHAEQRALPLTVACLVLFAIANLFPIVEMKISGLHSQTTLVGAVVALAREGMPPVALLVLVTTLVFPVAQLSALLYLLRPGELTRRPPGFRWLVVALQMLRPWSMVEVFMLGILVAIIKLSGMATVVLGPALWAFVALTVLVTAVVSFDPRSLWERAFEPTPADGQANSPGAPQRETADLA